MSERLLVVGGDPGGMAAATQARRRQPYMEIVALEKGPYTSYSACGLPYLVAGDVDSVDDLIARSPEEFRDRDRLDVRTRHEVMGVDLERGRAEVRDHARKRTFHLGFDLLHLATGARPLRPDLPGIDLPIVHGIQTLEDGTRLLDHLHRSEARRMVIVGGGYIGLEMAEAGIRRGVEVTVVEAADQVMGTFDPDMAAPIADALRRFGVDLRLGVGATAFDEDGVHTADGHVSADVVVLGLGVEPNSALAGEAGLRLGVRGAVRVDRRQRTSAPNVYAAGDCAESFHRVSRRQVHIALGTVANRQGRVAGINLGGGYATFPGVVGTAISKLCDLEVARTGLNEAEAARAGFGYEVTTVHTSARARYMPDPGSMTLKLLAERGSRKVLGVQIVGVGGVAKRIDVAATAITAGLTVDEIVDLDLSYAPPFSGVWDPIQIAARESSGVLDAAAAAGLGASASVPRPTGR